jgi:Domain of unknown function (DUF4347)
MTSTRPLTLVLVDSAVNDYGTLVNNLRTEAEVVVLDPNQDGVDQITEVLANHQDIESLHILSHGDAGKVYLGSTQLSADTLDHYTEKLENWAEALTADADILLYGCEVAAGETGQQFVKKLSQITQSNIAASTHLTGDADQGGDWNLEYTTGEIHTDRVSAGSHGSLSIGAGAAVHRKLYRQRCRRQIFQSRSRHRRWYGFRPAFPDRPPRWSRSRRWLGRKPWRTRYRRRWGAAIN